MVFYLRPARERRVDGTVSVAGHVQRLLDLLFVVGPVPLTVEGDVDLVEGLGPVFVLLAHDLDLQRAKRLLDTTDLPMSQVALVAGRSDAFA